MLVDFIHTSMFGSYSETGLLLEEKEDKYLIVYWDNVVEEWNERWLDKTRVTQFLSPF